MYAKEDVHIGGKVFKQGPAALPAHEEDSLTHPQNLSPKPYVIKNTGFSQRLSESDMSVFRRVCPDKHYAKGETIFYAGDPATDLHVIARGQVKLVTQDANGSERILVVCGVNDFIGEAFLTEASTYFVDAVALTDTVTCPVSRQQFLQMALHAPHFTLTFTEILASHLFHCREQLGHSYAPVKTRLVKTFLEQAERFGEPEESGWVKLETQLKHEELASMISATRVSVSMAIAELREAQLIVGTRGNYRIDVAALSSYL